MNSPAEEEEEDNISPLKKGDMLYRRYGIWFEVIIINDCFITPAFGKNQEFLRFEGTYFTRNFLNPKPVCCKTSQDYFGNCKMAIAKIIKEGWKIKRFKSE